MKNKKKYDYLAERFINKTNNLSFPYNIYWKTLRIWRNTYLIFHTKEMTKRQKYIDGNHLTLEELFNKIINYKKNGMNKI